MQNTLHGTEIARPEFSGGCTDRFDCVHGFCYYFYFDVTNLFEEPLWFTKQVEITIGVEPAPSLYYLEFLSVSRRPLSSMYFLFACETFMVLAFCPFTTVHEEKALGRKVAVTPPVFCFHSHSVDRAGWHVKMSSIEFCVASCEDWPHDHIASLLHFWNCVFHRHASR